MKKCLAMAALMLAMLVLPAMAQQTEIQPYALKPTAELWNTYEPRLHYYYNQLTESEKRLFSARYDALAKGDGDLWNCRIGDYGTLERARVNSVLCNDCPELMFYGTQLGGSYSLMQKPGDAYFGVNPEKITSYNEACYLIAQQVLSEPMTSYESELAIDRYIKLNCDYDNSADWIVSEEGHTAYSALALGNANCVGYTMGAMYLLRAAGIPCLAVYGHVGAYANGNNGHLWLMVEINECWYHYDPTWDDWGSAEYMEDFYPYLNLSTKEIGARSFRQMQDQYQFALPEALSMADNYYERNGKTLGEKWPTDMYRLVNSAHASGENAVGMRFADPEAYKEFVQNIKDGNYYPLDTLSFYMRFATDDNSKFVYLWW